MSRFTGPRVKVMRALGLELPGLSRNRLSVDPIHRVNTVDGATGVIPSTVSSSKRKKLKMNCGVSEKQMRHFDKKARRSKQETGLKLIELLERRLTTSFSEQAMRPRFRRSAARKPRARVNGRKVDVPSFCVGEGDVIELKARAKSSPSKRR